MTAQPKRVMVVFGTRPEAVKLAPIILALGESPHLEPIVVVTAQHREMLDQVTGLFGISYDADLDIMRPRQTLADITTRALSGLDALVAEHQPDALMVQGDTTTTFVGALAAHYHQVPVVHVEAGLRTHNRYSPFPEEMNRQLTSRLSTLHLAPTPASRANLLAEGIDRDNVVVTGNSVIDALLWTVGKRVDYADPLLDGLDDDPRRVLLVTAHRRESWGEPMVGVGRALGRIARAEPDLLIVLPVHRNPTVREALLPALEGLPNVIVTEPLAYGGFARLIDRAHVVLTDSGGVQEEAPSLGKPVLVMRENTERPEAVDAGTARLVGTDEGVVVDEVSRLLHDEAAHAAMANAVNPYGDGHAAARSVSAIEHLFGLGAAPREFTGEPLAAAL
jgi:UDP-N-acetylglucosamine 2-epimerase (non-hydrolysing)